MAMSAASSKSLGSARSPVQLTSGWLLSESALDIGFSTSFGHSLDPDGTILDQLEELDLRKLMQGHKYPCYYDSVIEVAVAFAKSLDDKHYSFTKGLHTLFLPKLCSYPTAPNKAHYGAFHSMPLELKLLD
ncbi:hypothetical protein FRC12_019514 [Ceratobasidium sp. 428]|nr:hypothetical protein FRC12_019514 [Ceratobasidium sp. 428]